MAALVLSFVSMACVESTSGPGSTGIVLTPPPGVLVGSDLALAPYLNRPDGRSPDPARVDWTSSDPSVARIENGRLRTRAAGQLTITARLDGTSASVELDVLGVTDVALGAEDGCALLTSGAALCWRGLIPVVQEGPERIEHVLPPAGERYVEIAVGRAHACASTDAGSLVCWGENRGFEVSMEHPRRERLAPVLLDHGHSYTSLSAGLGHTCGIDTNARLWCWGDNDHDQVSYESANRALPPTLVLGEQRFEVLGAGSQHTCASATTGETLCWGDLEEGAGGRGTFDIDPRPAPVETDTRYTQLAAGTWHSCGLIASGALECWGHNGFGELGTGQTSGRSAMPLVVAAARAFVAIDAGEFNTCALAEDASAWCWGTESGLGADVSGHSGTPLQVWLDAPAQSVATGGGRGCAATATGALYCWGETPTRFPSGRRWDTLAP